MEEILHNIHTERGLLWESIEDLTQALGPLSDTTHHHTEAMQDLMPVTHKLENGLYTREIFMPAGQLVVSFADGYGRGQARQGTYGSTH